MNSVLILFSIFFFALAPSLKAEEVKNLPPSAKAMIVKGDVFFEGKKLNIGDIIDRPGKITTGGKSFVKLFVEKWGNDINIGAKSEMDLNFSDTKKYTLLNGSCRWITAAKKALKDLNTDANKAKGGIFTRQASMGVRGTDFLLIANPLLGETQIIMFDGLVEFKNLNDENNKIEISKNQWGGIGGRFGQKIAPVINLNDEQLGLFKNQLSE